MSASHLPQGDSTSLRDMEAGGLTLESGPSGFSVSGGSREMFSLLTWRISTLHCREVVADGGSWGRLCRRCGLWGGHGLRRDYGL